MCLYFRFMRRTSHCMFISTATISTHPEVYVSLLQICANRKSLSKGKQVHAHILITGNGHNISLGTKLVSMYVKCGSIMDAHHVFDIMPKTNVLTWNAIIGGYAKHGYCQNVFALYCQMQREGLQPDNFTFPGVLKVCTGLAAMKEGKAIHECIIRFGFESDVVVGTALATMYANFGYVRDARQVFDEMSQRDTILWNAMIAGYTHNGHGTEALELFCQMRMAGAEVDSVTVVSVLPAFAHLADLREAKEVHGYIIASGFESDVSVGNALIDMYAKHHSLKSAHHVFDKMSQKDVVSWNTMIAAYAIGGHGDQAFKLFCKMQLEGIEPDSITISIILHACACQAVLQQGKEIHDYVIRNRFEWDVFVGNGFIDMYAKCGVIEDAHQVFARMSERDVISWNTMIMGYGMHGHCEDAFAFFDRMQEAGIKPNHITFTAVLSACSHAGLMNEGCQYFNSMDTDFCIKPGIEHYTCMVDLLGRSGQLDEAHDLIAKMPVKPNAKVWGALLGACRIHCNIEIGKRVAQILFDLEPENTGNYLLLANMYTVAGIWDDAAKVRKLLKDRGYKKKPGCSWIEVNNGMHAFLVGDQSHPQRDKIYETLKSLDGQMEMAGYVADTNFVIYGVNEEEKEYIL